MRKKENQIIEYLLKYDKFIPSKIISNDLNISIKTIRNYVKLINKDGTIILSNKNGYKLNKRTVDIYRNNLKGSEENPQDFDERCSHLIKLFLIQHVDSISIYDYCESIYISESLVYSDIKKFNVIYANMDVRLSIQDGNIYLIGDEEKKLKLLSKVIREEVPNCMVDMELLENLFPMYDVTKINNMIFNKLREENYSINDLIFPNLMLHIMIILNSLEAHSKEKNNKELNEELSVFKDILNNLEDIVGYYLSTRARKQIISLLYLFTDISDKNKALEITDSKYYIIAKECSVLIEEIYGIELSNEEFLFPLSHHLRRLEDRCRNNIQWENPLRESIKDNYPALFELSIFMCNYFGEQMNVTVNEDEISLISLYISWALINEKCDNKKIRTVLIVPHYLGIYNTIFAKLESQFKDDLDIIGVINTLDFSLSDDVDLIVSVFDVKHFYSSKAVQISVNLNNKDLLCIYNAIEEIKALKKRNILKSNFDRLFDENIFCVDSNALTQGKVIKKVCSLMEEKGYVTNEFYSNVLKREQMASTAFNTIAVPHALKMNSKTTKIGVFINNKGIKWGKKKVNIVFLVSINPSESLEFIKIYEALIELIDNSIIFDKLLKVTNYKEFKQIILSNL